MSMIIKSALAFFVFAAVLQVNWGAFHAPAPLTSTARAVVGMPATPVSVAGVARRTVRRCAVGVYNCH